LQGLAAQVPLAPGARVLDAGCGLGDGLRALRRAYPQARLEGVEWSWPLRFLCALRCPWAQVRRGDMWRTDWSSYQLVYLFQRPESMARAAAKAQAEMASGSWLVSLEFAVPGVLPQAQLRLPGDRVVWIYRFPQGTNVKRKAGVAYG
ncbi:MAG: class I SAM-dependent methyltransferase, partial [Nitrospirota bacterium]